MNSAARYATLYKEGKHLMKSFFSKITPLQIIIFLGAWIPLALIVIDFFTGRLSINPIQDIEQRTGRLAILWVVLSLVATPMNSLFKWKEPIKRRRALGLYGFMYAFIHVTIFVLLDFGFNWKLIINEVLERNFIIVGTISFTFLTALAATSFNYWKKKLKKNWKRLHATIYVIAPLIVIHYAWAKKGDIFSLQGDIIKPLIYGIIVIVLLVVRIKPVKKAVASLVSKFTGALRGRQATA
jgi:sulfoxide reductase heme-binding subunit YedZ